jgi:putative ABC transport system permease protein
MHLTDFQIAARNLAQHTKRNLFLGGAIAAVTALLVLMGGLTSGMRAAIFESATTLMTGHVNLAGFFKITSGTGSPLVTDYEKALAVARKAVPEIDHASPRMRGYGKLVSDTSSMDMVLAGVDIEAEPEIRRVLRLSKGNLDDLSKPNTILLFEDQAKRLAVGVGDALTISSPTARGVNNTADLLVVAVAKNVGLLSAFNAFVPSGTLRELYQLNAGTTGAVHLYLKNPDQSAQVAARLRDALTNAKMRVMDPDPQAYFMKFQRVNSEDWVGQKLDVTTWEDEMSFLTWILQAIQGLTGLLVTILMVIVVIGIMNTLAIAIRERTKEIGTLRAIGMQRTKVLWLFLIEAALLGVAGATTGALVGSGVAALINAAHVSVPESVQMFLMQQHLTVSLRIGSVVVYAALIAAITTLASLYPAFYAARLRPITAIHHIG